MDLGIAADLCSRWQPTTVPSFTTTVNDECAAIMNQLRDGDHQLMWLYWHTSNGFKADWVLVHATPIADRAGNQVRLKYLVFESPGMSTTFGDNVDGVVASNMEAAARARIRTKSTGDVEGTRGRDLVVDIKRDVIVWSAALAEGAVAHRINVEGMVVTVSAPPLEYSDVTSFIMNTLPQYARDVERMPP